MCVKVGFVEEDGWMHVYVKQINAAQRHTYQGPVSGLHSQMTEWKILLNQWFTFSYPTWATRQKGLSLFSESLLCTPYAS